jgi:glycosyltransferase involved in cell wall biosynthesis
MVEQNPLVSVVIPYFNKETTIERSVDSVINQTHNRWEIIIVDDCSNIKLEKLAKWDNYNITVLYNEINLGPGPSRQKALDMSKGEYVAFLDADDWLLPEFLEISLECHIQNLNQVCFTWSKTNTLFSNGEIRERKNNHLNLNLIRETLIKYGHPWSTSSILWNKKFCAKWKDLTTNQDSLFEFDSSLFNNNVIHINQTLCIKDETVGNNRVDLVKREIIIRNRYNLYLHIYKNSFNKFNLMYKLILLNRLFWSIEKLGTTEYRVLISYNSIVRNFKIVIAKIIHRILQFSPFKIIA